MDWNNFFGLEKRDKPADFTFSAANYGGFEITPNNGLNLPAFFQCVALISSSIASLPIMVKKKTGSGKTNVMKNHPVNLLFNDKMNHVAKYNMMKNIITNIIMRGNAFIFIERAADGTPVKLRYLESGDVSIQYDKFKDELYYIVTSLNKKKVLPKDILHFKQFSWDGIKGVSVLAFAARSLGIYGATEDQAKNFFKNGCNLDGIIKVHNQVSKEQREQILNSWTQSYSHAGNKIAVLPGNMDWQSVSINAEDAQLLQSREYSAADICRFLNINPAMIGIKGYNGYSTFEDNQNEFLVRTLTPYLISIEEEFARKLLTEEEKNVKVILDTTEMLRTNKQAQASYFATLLDKGVLSVNEVRESLGYNKVENGDRLTIAYTDVDQNTLNKNDNSNTENTEE